MLKKKDYCDSNNKMFFIKEITNDYHEISQSLTIKSDRVGLDPVPSIATAPRIVKVVSFIFLLRSFDYFEHWGKSSSKSTIDNHFGSGHPFGT